LLKSIWQQIELSWSNTDALPEYVEFVRQALSGDRSAADVANRDPSKWALLPGLCCQAAGGDLHWADSLAAAWLMFYLAADLMDSVEDQDEPDEWWAESGPALAINAATGLFFCASRCLHRYYQSKETANFAFELIDDFYTDFFHMCGGQHLDITNPRPSLEQYWKIAESKSGTFFSLACRSGARLATHDTHNLDCFNRLGNHLGIIVQILDDLEDLKGLSTACLPVKSAGIFQSLPVVYAMEVSPASVQKQLQENLLAAPQDIRASRQSYELLEKSGVVIYIMSEIERHKQKTRDCLKQVSPQIPAMQQLVELINRLDSSV
jgi:geranylgeranyl pyrophosphate synthase